MNNGCCSDKCFEIYLEYANKRRDIMYDNILSFVGVKDRSVFWGISDYYGCYNEVTREVCNIDVIIMFIKKVYELRQKKMSDIKKISYVIDNVKIIEYENELNCIDISIKNMSREFFGMDDYESSKKVICYKLINTYLAMMKLNKKYDVVDGQMCEYENQKFMIEKQYNDDIQKICDELFYNEKKDNYNLNKNVHLKIVKNILEYANYENINMLCDDIKDGLIKIREVDYTKFEKYNKLIEEYGKEMVNICLLTNEQPHNHQIG